VVNRDRRGQGIGKKLLGAVEQRAKDWGFETIALLVDEQNVNAQKLYKRIGFKEVFTTANATRIVPGKLSLHEERCSNIFMRKGLGSGNSLADIRFPDFANALNFFQ
jgi:RimJ/RimL family protein N-acetyltransferase